MDIKSLFGFVISLLGCFFVRLWHYTWQYSKVDQNMELLSEAIEHLQARSDDIKVHVTMAKLQLKTRISEVEQWLEKVESIKAEVNHLNIEYSEWKSYHGVGYLIFWKPFIVSHRLSKKLQEVNELRDKLPHPAAQELPSTPRVQAMDPNRDRILGYLIDDEVKMIGIWGMGGVGKTTLLKIINSYFAHIKLPLFDHVIFVVASKDDKLEELQKKIHKNLLLPSEADDDINSRATHLFNFLKKKKVLFLLDNLWEHVDLATLGIPLGQDKCKVIFTTRSVNVCGLMEAERKLRVECLDREDAWSLFEEKLGEDIKDDPNISRLAKEVAKKCCGLPLALIIIGRVMSSKKTWREWQHALNLLCSSRPYDISGMQDAILPILELSYQNLQDDTIRECFLTCSMWPKNHYISKEDLIVRWMGLGLIDDYNEINEAYDKGHSIIESLVGASLLEHDDYAKMHDMLGYDDYVKMNDMVRDLAFWLVSNHGKNKNKWMVQAGLGLKDCKAEKWQGPHQISLMYNEIKFLPEQLPDCRNLSVLTLYNNLHLEYISEGAFHRLRSLTYLDLGWSDIHELPAAVGELVNLEFLNLGHTFIRSMPDELGNLVNLKFLLLEHTSIHPIPWKSISHLPKLKLLSLLGCEAIEISSVEVYVALLQLDGRLMGLGISIETVALDELLGLSSTISFVKLGVRFLKGTESLELLMLALLRNKAATNSLKVLDIYHCESSKVLIVNSVDVDGIPSLPRLEVLQLRSLTLLERIVWRGVTPKEFLSTLQRLMIANCDKLKDVSWVLQLPNLECLTFSSCHGLEMVIRDGEDGGGGEEAANRVKEPTLAFPRLRKLEFHSLGRLGSICGSNVPFPSLETIYVDACPELKKLPFQSWNIPTKLRQINGSAKWWEHLEWEDDSTKPLLQKYFKIWQFA